MPTAAATAPPFSAMPNWNKLGIPILAGIYGTNPAGGGYQGISPTILLAHKNCNIAVGGGGIVSGMSPKGSFDEDGAEQIIEATRHFKQVPPGSVKIHLRFQTGFFRAVYEKETEVLDALKEYMAEMPAYHPRFFRVAEPAEPKYPLTDLPSLIAFNQKAVYDFDNFLARLVDNSEHLEFRPGLRSRGLYRPGQGRRLPDGGHRQPAGFSRAQVSGIHQRIYRASAASFTARV